MSLCKLRNSGLAYIVCAVILIPAVSLAVSCERQASKKPGAAWVPEKLEKELPDVSVPEMPEGVRADLGHIPGGVDTLGEGKSLQVFQKPQQLPDFSSIQDVRKRKRRFFEYLRPLVRAENSRIRRQRARLVELYRTFDREGGLSEKDREQLRELCGQYRVKWRDPPDRELFHSLLLRVDIVPLELALAQAANESGWGTSRFARKGNNIFGEWCFKPGCGIVPRDRYPGKVHEVAVFSSPIKSLRSYMNKLNSHPAYEAFRALRYEMKLRGRRPDGYTLAKGLTKYSSLRQEYVQRIQGMIRSNLDMMIPEPSDSKQG